MSKTYGEQMKGALACETPEEAAVWLEAEIKIYVDEHDKTPEEAKEIILHNLGYMAGYYSKETSMKIKRLFQADHPIFGGPEYWDNLKPVEAFELGRNRGEEVKEELEGDAHD